MKHLKLAKMAKMAKVTVTGETTGFGFSRPETDLLRNAPA
jgi:hypothetical protein